MLLWKKIITNLPVRNTVNDTQPSSTEINETFLLNFVSLLTYLLPGFCNFSLLVSFVFCNVFFFPIPILRSIISFNVSISSICSIKYFFLLTPKPLHLIKLILSIVKGYLVYDFL
jgi:hypothetical protein